jgi:hypothetical protein
MTKLPNLDEYDGTHYDDEVMDEPTYLSVTDGTINDFIFVINEEIIDPLGFDDDEDDED